MRIFGPDTLLPLQLEVLNASEPTDKLTRVVEHVRFECKRRPFALREASSARGRARKLQRAQPGRPGWAARAFWRRSPESYSSSSTLRKGAHRAPSRRSTSVRRRVAKPSRAQSRSRGRWRLRASAMTSCHVRSASSAATCSTDDNTRGNGGKGGVGGEMPDVTGLALLSPFDAYVGGARPSNRLPSKRRALPPVTSRALRARWTMQPRAHTSIRPWCRRRSCPPRTSSQHDRRFLWAGTPASLAE